MRLLSAALALFLVGMSLSACRISEAGADATPASQPPIVPKVPKTTTIHGYSRVDDYLWLREKDNPKVAQAPPSQPRTTADRQLTTLAGFVGRDVLYWTDAFRAKDP